MQETMGGPRTSVAIPILRADFEVAALALSHSCHSQIEANLSQRCICKPHKLLQDADQCLKQRVTHSLMRVDGKHLSSRRVQHRCQTHAPIWVYSRLQTL